MRLLRELPDELSAQRLVDALSDQGIETELKRGESALGVWVIDEAHMRRASDLASGWLERGEREAYERSASRGMRARELSARIEERRLRQRDAVARQLQALTRPRPAPLTWGLIALSIAVGLLTELGAERTMVAGLTITDPRVPADVTLVSVFGFTFPWLALPLYQPWRLVTPILVHFGLLHILFNMLWLRDLGRIIEGAHGARYLGAFVIVCAVISNIAQYQIGQHPLFAGMSGVVYGLLALIWLRGRLDPWVGYGLSTSTMQFMLIWFVLGFVGNFGIANWCHLFGLLVGGAWAYLAHKLARR